MIGKYDVQPQLPFPVEADPNQPELPLVSEKELIEKGDFLFLTLLTIDQNLANTEGLTKESIEELEASRAHFEQQLGDVLELGAELGMFREGAPADNYEAVAA